MITMPSISNFCFKYSVLPEALQEEVPLSTEWYSWYNYEVITVVDIIADPKSCELASGLSKCDPHSQSSSSTDNHL